MIQTIAVIGAGTMGAGIAQVFAQQGFSTLLFDVNANALNHAKNGICQQFDALVAKGKLTEKAASEALQCVRFIADDTQLEADLFIEAIIEQAAPKRAVFEKIMERCPNAIFCSNTSSLSITGLAAGLTQSSRFAGLHFFNPAPVMKLVEIVRGAATDANVITALQEICARIGKTSVVCEDAPGFIVNRVARHYYVESLKLAEEGVASISTTDQLMEAAGFKMGPFKLMDTIGNDINYAVTQSLHQAFQGHAKFRPSRLQFQKVQAGHLGKKTGKGFYDYSK
ncbi:MAG: 3-hydroxyacyl-CoA dehydrogenase NAD-binding domain-containing protein [Chitinophagales bacterium]